MLKRAGKLQLDTLIINGVTVRAFGGGEAIGPDPVNRGRQGTRHTVMVSKEGVPLVIHTAGAKASEYTIPAGRPRLTQRKRHALPRRDRPDEARADRGYGRAPLSAFLRWLGIEPHTAKRRTPHRSACARSAE